MLQRILKCAIEGSSTEVGNLMEEYINRMKINLLHGEIKLQVHLLEI